jgi:hypothetical protein
MLSFHIDRGGFEDGSGAPKYFRMQYTAMVGAKKYSIDTIY